MLEYARWKYILVVVVLILAILFALPTVFGEDPALQIATKDHTALPAAVQPAVQQLLKGDHVPFDETYMDDGRLMVRFHTVAAQLRGRDVLNAKYGDQYAMALAYAPRAPAFLRAIGLQPMPLGLDLRGGLYLLYQVDVNSAIQQLLQSYAQDIRSALEDANLPLTGVTVVAVNGTQPNGLRVALPASTDVGKARAAILKAVPDIASTLTPVAGGFQLNLTPAQVRSRQDYAIQQNITTLRNRVNALGVAEPIVQRQGLDRINVQLPGVQNSAEVKDILGRVATLQFRLEYTQGNAVEAAQRGRAPIGAKLYYNRDHQPFLLKRDIIATGDELIDAHYENGQNGPEVAVKLDARAGRKMLNVTRENLHHRMGVVLIETHRETQEVNGKKVAHEVTNSTLINIATIQGVFSNNFVITGLQAGEARDLALLLRSGSLAATIYPVEERTVGPSLGKQNIREGVTALIVGMLLTFLFMGVYYKLFGLVADLVLLANVVVLAALLAGLHSDLSLPGIAGIVLTVGMAVDANILIYERIREEIRNKVTPQAAIRAGFEKAFSAIADANVTTLIAGVVLWIFGTGPVRGFAVVLTLGIVTSMFTALMGSRALITLIYGRKRKIAHLPI